MGPGVLSSLLSKIPIKTDEKLIVGFSGSDDACAYSINDHLAVVQTVDFFPPMVDDPFIFGQIAAANALSDIFAMGAEPALALNMLGFPSCLPLDVAEEILSGGASKVTEAGAVIAGGHSIQSTEPLYGLCVTGFINPAHLWQNAAAKAGDILILTKPIGSGINNTAAKAGLLTDRDFQPTLDAMTTLNKYARDVIFDESINACTDVTGFGLLGHLCEIAKSSGKTIALYSSQVTLLPYTHDMAKRKMIPGGTGRNKDYFSRWVLMDSGIPAVMQNILYDPQTSGGLLISAAEKNVSVLLAGLKQVCPNACVIGQVKEYGGAAVLVLP